MRIGTGLVLAGAIAISVGAAAWLKTPILRASPTPSVVPDLTVATSIAPVLATAPDPEKVTALPTPSLAAAQPARATCNNPSALGVARTVEIDTTGGPGFGFEHFKQLDFLRDKEVVLTFDDGPWPINTPAVLRALADECTTGIFFAIDKHATYHPEILKQVYVAGHTVGSTHGHTPPSQIRNSRRINARGRSKKVSVR